MGIGLGSDWGDERIPMDETYHENGLEVKQGREGRKWVVEGSGLERECGVEERVKTREGMEM